MMDTAGARTRYEGQVAELAAPVTFAETSWDPEWHVVRREELPAGTAVYVESVSNAGFRGIEAFCRVPGTKLTSHVSVTDELV